MSKLLVKLLISTRTDFALIGHRGIGKTTLILKQLIKTSTNYFKINCIHCNQKS